LTDTSWPLSVLSCHEGQTRLDREIRVGAPARRTDGSGRRTAGRWVCATPVPAVRSSGLRAAGRDSRKRGSGRPREFLGAPMTPRGPIGREQAGSPAGQPDGALGGRHFSSSGHPHGRPRQDRPPTKAVPASSIRRTAPAYRPRRSPLVLVRATNMSALSIVNWQVIVARRTRVSVL
jgi:hypothetical protein